MIAGTPPAPAPDGTTVPSAAATPMEPSMVATVLAALPPLALPVTGLVALALVLRGGLFRAIEEAGWAGWLVLATTFFVSLFCAVLGGVAARGIRLPAVVGLFLVTLPWVVGLAGMRLGMRTASRAVANADASSRATMIAQGLSEAIHARILGGWATASLAAALALSLAIAAAGQRATNRKWPLAAVGLVLALPLLGVTGWALTTHALGKAILLVALLSLGAVVALPLTTGAPAGDAPHGRAAAMSASAAVFLLVAWLAGIAAISSQMTAEVFGAIANVDPADRITVLAASLDDMRVGTVLGWVGGGTLALAALVVTAWSATRARPSVGRIVGGLALVGLATLVLLADGFVKRASEDDVATTARAPWDGVAGFAPIELTTRGRGDGWATGETLVLGADGLRVGTQLVGAAELATPAGADHVARLVRAQLAMGAAGDDEHLPDWLRDPEPSVGERLERPQRDPAIGLALDARTTAAAMRSLVVGATQGGAHSFVLMGVSHTADPAARDRVAAEAPALAALLSQPVSVSLLLEPALPNGFADRDRMLWHATLDASGQGEITPRAGAAGAPLRYPTPPHGDESTMGAVPDEDSVVYLALGDGATASSLAAATSAAANERYQPLLVTHGLPGNPDQPAGGVMAGLLGALGGGDAGGIFGGTLGDSFGAGGLGFGGLGLGGLGRVPGGGTGDPGAEGTIGLGNLGTIGHGGGEGGGGAGFGGLGSHDGSVPVVRTGESDVRGSLSREVITRVIRRHINEVRFCYERSLRDHPSLAGRVTVRFVISATGSVQSASVESSTLANADAESCIAAAVQRWQFPSPEGGGIVIVSYPFVLTADTGN